MTTIEKLDKLIADLAEARRTATMETAGFGWDKVTTTGNPCGPDGSPGTPCVNHDVTDFIRQRTAPWRQSWILAPLDEALLILEEMRTAALRGE